MRRCSKTGCQSPALATLTYNYADSQVVIGPLSRRAEPHTYDLCGEHARRTTAPRCWEVLRLELPEHYESLDADGFSLGNLVDDNVACLGEGLGHGGGLAGETGLRIRDAVNDLAGALFDGLGEGFVLRLHLFCKFRTGFREQGG